MEENDVTIPDTFKPWLVEGAKLLVYLVSTLGVLGYMVHDLKQDQDDLGKDMKILQTQLQTAVSGRIEQFNSRIQVLETRLAYAEGQIQDRRDIWTKNDHQAYDQQLREWLREELRDLKSQISSLKRGWWLPEKPKKGTS